MAARKKYKVVCRKCKKSFHPHRRQQKFCSLECSVNGRVGEKRKNQKKCKCSNCGSTLLRNQYRAKTSKRFFCNRDCKAEFDMTAAVGRKNPNFRDAGRHICEGCKKKFKHYNKLRRFCSLQCTHNYAADHPMHAAQLGLKYELLAMKRLVKMGFVVGKTRASRGAYDIFGSNGKEILLIQVKKTSRRKLSPRDWKDLIELKVPSNCRKEVWINNPSGVWKTIVL